MKKYFRANYLEFRYKTYYAVLYVPKNLQAYVGKTKFTKTTQTSNLKIAIERASAFVLAWQNELSIARYQSQDSFIAAALELRTQLRNSTDFLLSETIKEIIGEEDAKFRNNPSDNYFDDDFTAMATGKTKVLETFVSKWLDYGRGRGLKAKTVDQQGRDIKNLTGLFKTASSLTEKNVTEWINYCVAEDNLSASSVTRIIIACRDFFDYLKIIKEVEDEVVSPFKIPSQFKKTKKSRKSNAATKSHTNSWIPFKPREVEQLHRLALVEGKHTLANLIVIAAYTGARLSEICALENKDIELDNDSFHIRDAKTEAGIREVPIHSKIKPLFTQLSNASKDGYLISGLGFNKYMDRSNAIGKQFGRLKTKYGFSTLHVFHSIRKTAITLLENAHVSEGLAADIVGHEKPNITYGLYSGGNSITVKKEAIEKLKYDFEININ